MWQLAVVIGTRPEAIKMAPVIQACQACPDMCCTVISSGQQPDLVPSLLPWFGITIDQRLHIMRRRQTVGRLLARGVASVEEALEHRRYDAVLAVGDTTSVLATALAARCTNTPLVHVEAGLRTAAEVPWPEEWHRRAVTHLATLHCAATQRAVDQLRREGIDAASIVLTGNPIVDVLHRTIERLHTTGREALIRDEVRLLADRRIVVVTCHRRENAGAGLEQVIEALRQLAVEHRDVTFVVPVHVNPSFRQPMVETLENSPNVVLLLEPLSYPEFIWLLARAELALSDSGGIQEEVPTLGTPLLILRDVTERPEVLDTGLATLVGTQAERIVAEAQRRLRHPRAIETVTVQDYDNPFGDGRAGPRIVGATRLLLERTGNDR